MKFNRIAKLLATGAANQVLTLIQQMLFVPVALACWGAAMTADWIVLSALTASFAYLDLGFSQAVGNRLVHSFAQGRAAELMPLYRTTRHALLLLLGMVTVVVGGLVALIDVNALLKLSSHSPLSGTVFVIQLATLLVAQLANLELNLLRAMGEAVSAASCALAFRLVEITALVGAPLLRIELLTLALWLLVIKCVFALWCIRRSALRVRAAGIPPAQGHAWHLLRELAAPSLAFLAVPVGYAINGQMLIAVVSAAGGAEQALLLSVTRTFARILFQAGNWLAGALSLDFTLSFGQGAHARLGDIFVSSLNLLFWGLVPAACVMAITGGWFVDLWTGGRLEVPGLVVVGILAESVALSFWSLGMSLVGSANSHLRAAWVFVGATLVACAVVAGLYERLGVHGAALISAAAVTASALYTLKSACMLLDCDLCEVFVRCANPRTIRQSMGNLFR